VLTGQAAGERDLHRIAAQRGDAMSWPTALLVAAVVVSSGAPLPAAHDRLRVTLTPQISYEPGAVRIVAYVAPDADNRRLVVEAESGAHFTSSDVPLDGDRQPIATIVWLKNLPAGQYELQVRLEQGRGPDLVRRRGFAVLGSLDRGN
jgi:hypothetical protein